MKLAARGALAATMITAALIATAVPATAGDVAPANGSIVGDWKTRTLGIKQTATFDKDGRVYGDSGCNRFTGSYTIKGDRIKIGPLASTLKACPQPRMDAEMIFLTKLQAAVIYSATDTALRIYTSKDYIGFRAA
jgi:heat shock protein HslJ